MLKTLLSGLLVTIICSFVNAYPTTQPSYPETTVTDRTDSPLEDPAARSQRSANLSHVTGTARKIKMYIKNRFLQILPDGTVNGTTDERSVYAILQRTTVDIGQVKIQGIATCQYICMANCGLLYGSKEYSDECVFNESISPSFFNSYSSRKYSNKKRTLYLALNRRGQSRKLVIRAHHQAGKLMTYIQVLTRNVPQEILDELMPMTRHHNHTCTSTSDGQRPKHRPGLQRCPKRRKRKKKKRKCTGDGGDSDSCQKKQKGHKRHVDVSKCDEDDDSELCHENSM